MITAEKFREATGRDPEDDDLERCNCPEAGDFGHRMCGWDEEHDQPMFVTYPLHAVNYPCETKLEREREIIRTPRNFYEPPLYNMVTSGEFWRCFHGVTRFDGDGCPDCKKDWKGDVEINDAE